MASPVTVVDIAQDEVLTGEAVALDIQPTGFFLRALGALIDIVLAVLVYVLFILVMLWAGGSGLDPALAPILSIAMLVVVAVVIPTVVETATHGRSLGKLAVGGRIVRADGGAAGFRQAFIRALVGVLEIWMTFGAVAAVTGIFTPRAQRLGDLLAGTYSQRTRSPRLPEIAPVVPPALAAWATVADVAPLPERLARRLSQFVRQAEDLQPAARARLARDLAAAVSASVSPVPEVDPELFVRAVVAVRFSRELAAVRLRDARAATLLRD
ncbi:RDD family protein [Microbacterium sp. cx-55]|uniref:RDD family protein n=1 Tax=unclassified Microbacterium TaxID=2609290 RepID=UPI001CC0BDD8|nr:MULTISPECIES: RDD family protein [unclassified Microbacterium]MBZ4488743.1 RDD family protein [Microbacterium sp. cx-55]MCC4909570.1 RDD family protein [Microbacterium sp. cx-59]UGB36022.1 RDD family protein [Microbacterium sp. cx-55]